MNGLFYFNENFDSHAKHSKSQIGSMPCSIVYESVFFFVY